MKTQIQGGRRKVLEMEKQIYLANMSQYEGLSLREISRRSGHHATARGDFLQDDWPCAVACA